MTLPAFITEVIDKIQLSGFDAFAVGGCVRDFILGKAPSDWDITTSAKPCDIVRIFSEHHIVPTGIKHGTVTVLTPYAPIEITTYRIDGSYLDFRRPENVAFSKNLEDDLKRRDFTINAMAYNQSSGLIDLFNGKKDLGKRTIRCVGDPKKRFSEDALRIMRALRFGATLNFEIEDGTAKALFECRQLLNHISNERISAELSKLLLADNPSNILNKYLVIFAHILGFDEESNTPIWEQNTKALCRAEKILPLRLALLLDGLSFKASPGEVLKRLKYDNKTISCVKVISSYLSKNIPNDEVLLKKELMHIGPDSFRIILKAKLAKAPSDTAIFDRINKKFEKIVAEGQCYSLKNLAVNGSDIQACFDINGQQTGLVLNALLDAVICGKCQNDKEKLLNYTIENLL